MGVSKHLTKIVLDKYGKKLADKHLLISRHIKKFLNEYYPNDDNFTIIVSGDQISDVVINYFIDIDRFKERRDMLSDSDKVSAGKIAAFTAKWLVKFKPITIIPMDQSKTTRETCVLSRHINEFFAVAHIEFLIEAPLEKTLVRELIFEFRQKKLSETQLYMTLEQCMGFYANR